MSYKSSLARYSSHVSFLSYFSLMITYRAKLRITTPSGYENRREKRERERERERGERGEREREEERGERREKREEREERERRWEIGGR